MTSCWKFPSEAYLEQLTKRSKAHFYQSQFCPQLQCFMDVLGVWSAVSWSSQKHTLIAGAWFGAGAVYQGSANRAIAHLLCPVVTPPSHHLSLHYLPSWGSVTTFCQFFMSGVWSWELSSSNESFLWLSHSQILPSLPDWQLVKEQQPLCNKQLWPLPFFSLPTPLLRQSCCRSSRSSKFHMKWLNSPRPPFSNNFVQIKMDGTWIKAPEEPSTNTFSFFRLEQEWTTTGVMM